MWYRESGQRMSATFQVANQLCAYTLCEIGTLLSHRSRLDLDILMEGDPATAQSISRHLGESGTDSVAERGPGVGAMGASGCTRDTADDW